ncbi:MAG: fumarylacetoacetate hydrolase family protein [Bacteroidetes bacterium]|nr:fumarylacetoacetate hydrolase family protein [Bacteroidota bacterium]
MILTDPDSGTPVKVGKILCIGRNYALHAAEMNDAVPTHPVIFLKPPTSLIKTGDCVILPQMSTDVHHEVELVVMIGQGGKNIPLEQSLNHVAAYALGLDMTARDIQSDAKAKGNPWSVAKGFDTFAPLGPLVPSSQITDPQTIILSLTVNDQVKQQGSTSDMIFSVPYLISYCSKIFTLEKGDLLYTGTPEGVGPVTQGDQLKATSDQLATLEVTVN